MGFSSKSSKRRYLYQGHPFKVSHSIFLGLIHFISLAKSKDKFHDSCHDGFGLGIDTSGAGDCDKVSETFFSLVSSKDGTLLL